MTADLYNLRPLEDGPARSKAEELWRRDYPECAWPPMSASNFSKYIQKAKAAMTADLLARARAATTRDEECAVIYRALRDARIDEIQHKELSRIIGSVRAGNAPRAVLLGVVAALVPDESGFMAQSSGHRRSHMGKPHDACTDGQWSHSSTSVALALLIALLESDNVEA